jgi:hypothetical protein
VPEGEEDRAAVQRLFELVHAVVEELAPNMQIIVCDHANLPDPWFQEAVAENNWREDRKLIPDVWIGQGPPADASNHGGSPPG